jgi:hypothetical protein
MKEGSGQQESDGGSRENVAIGFVVGLLLGGLVDLYTGERGIGTLAGMVLGAVLGARGLPRVYLMEYPPGVIRNLVISGALFAVVFMGAVTLIDRESGGGWRTVLAFAPAAPGLLFAVALGKAIAGLDELQRRIQVEALAIGFGITALVTLTVGLLGLAGTRQPNWMTVPALMTFAWLAGKLWTRWKYR